MSNRRTTGQARLWAVGTGMAAAAAAVIGMGTAHADDGSVPTDIALLNTAQADIAEAFSLNGQTPDTGFFPELEAIQTPLLSSDNSFVSGFGEALFNGPDQQLAQTSEAFLAAAETLSSDTTNLTALGDYASTGFQATDAIFGEIPSTLIGKLTDQIFGLRHREPRCGHGFGGQRGQRGRHPRRRDRPGDHRREPKHRLVGHGLYG